MRHIEKESRRFANKRLALAITIYQDISPPYTQYHTSQAAHHQVANEPTDPLIIIEARINPTRFT